TLTLSPQAGRGDARPTLRRRGTEAVRRFPFSPFTGRRCRQADEGAEGHQTTTKTNTGEHT
ncbi:MAG TPA: hypothetical protein DDW73_01125, partial [Rhizobium sp.]|nr:hypothetical protein [Rhizobium sp.]